MARWIRRFELETSFDEFMTTPSAANPAVKWLGPPVLFGEWNGLTDDVTAQYSNGLHYLGKDPTYTPVERGWVSDTPLNPNDANDARYLDADTYWSTPEHFWNRTSVRVVEVAQDERSVGIEDAVVAALKPFTVDRPPKNPHESLLPGMLIDDHRDAFASLQDVFWESAEAGDWVSIGPLRAATINAATVSSSEGSINIGSFQAWYYENFPGSLSNVTTGLPAENLEAFQRYCRGAGVYDSVGGVLLDTLTTAPVLQATNSAMSTGVVESDTAEVKLAAYYSSHQQRVTGRLSQMQGLLNDFSDTFHTEPVDLIAAAETFSGKSIAELLPM